MCVQECRIKAYWLDLMLDRSRYDNTAAAREHMRLPPGLCEDLVQDIVKAGGKLAKVVDLSMKVHTDRYNQIIRNIVQAAES